MYSFNFCWFSLSRHHKNLKKTCLIEFFFYIKIMYMSTYRHMRTIQIAKS